MVSKVDGLEGQGELYFVNANGTWYKKEPNFQYNNYQQQPFYNNQQGGYQARENYSKGFSSKGNQSTHGQAGSSTSYPLSLYLCVKVFVFQKMTSRKRSSKKKTSPQSSSGNPFFYPTRSATQLDPTLPSRTSPAYLKSVQEFYRVSSGVVFRVPVHGESAEDPPEGFFTCYEAFLTRCRMWFSIPEAIVRALDRFELSISQLNVAALQNFLGVLILSYELGMDLSPDDFEGLWSTRKTSIDYSYRMAPKRHIYNDLNNKFLQLSSHFKALENQFASMPSTSKSQMGSLPEKSEQNPKEYCNVIFSTTSEIELTDHEKEKDQIERLMYGTEVVARAEAQIVEKVEHKIVERVEIQTVKKVEGKVLQPVRHKAEKLVEGKVLQLVRHKAEKSVIGKAVTQLKEVQLEEAHVVEQSPYDKLPFPQRYRICMMLMSK
ncbi:hypothetical protein F2Q70_00043920 [Brassica cretica]|uniref:Uncharacterized protein n=1 Tax=Brassica cretica TaxID=69181 RepID=A0A8S9KJQ4_BRACR|nr:hypothetical protein F2Q70_00043920 [Brassica cretica]